MGKEAYYFSHDANARNDSKILALRSVYGAEGYGWYWMIVEILREQAEFKHKITGKYWCNALAMQMQCECKAIEEFVHDCIEEFELFVSDGEYFWSDSLNRRMAKKEEKSKKAKQAADTRWGNSNDESESDADAMQPHSDGNADAMQGKESKGNEIKEKRNKNIPYQEIVDYLNVKAKRNYLHTTAATQSKIKARYAEGFTFEDFKKVIDVKVKEWLNDTNMQQYLRPDTLFGTKFESYLNQVPARRKEDDKPREQFIPPLKYIDR